MSTVSNTISGDVTQPHHRLYTHEEREQSILALIQQPYINSIIDMNMLLTAAHMAHLYVTHIHFFTIH
jgi:hypothetical protein